MDDKELLDRLYPALIGEAQETLDLCLGLTGEKRRQLVRATMYYFLTEYYGWAEYRVCKSFALGNDNVAMVKRGAEAAKGQVNGGKYKRFCDNLLAFADARFYIDGNQWKEAT